MDLNRFVVDGPGDLGLDGIYYNKATRVIYFVQTKLRTNTKGFSEDEANKFVRGLSKLVQSDLRDANSKIVELNEDIQSALGSINTRVQLLAACSSDADISDSVKSIFEDYCREQNKIDDMFSFKYLALKDVYSSARLFSRDVSVKASIVFDEVCHIKKPHECLLGVVSGEQVARMVENHGDRLFDQNVRLTLHSSEINDDIICTAKFNASHFFYLNNGITAICSSFKAPPNAAESKLFEAADLSIVNGAQTAGMLARAKFDNTNLSSLKVTFRLISLANAPAGFDESVTRANNSQNSLSSLDFVSLDPRQEFIRNELAPLGYSYNVKRGGALSQGLETIEIKDAAVALACKRSISLTAQAKRYVSGLWQDTKSSAYQEIFPENISGREVLSAWRLYNECRQAIQTKGAARGSSLASILTHSEKFIAYIAFQMEKQEKEAVDYTSLAISAVEKTLRAYEDGKASNPAYDFRNVKLLEDMAAEILNK